MSYNDELIATARRKVAHQVTITPAPLGLLDLLSKLADALEQAESATKERIAAHLEELADEKDAPVYERYGIGPSRDGALLRSAAASVRGLS